MRFRVPPVHSPFFGDEGGGDSGGGGGDFGGAGGSCGDLPGGRGGGLGGPGNCNLKSLISTRFASIAFISEINFMARTAVRLLVSKPLKRSRASRD